MYYLEFGSTHINIKQIKYYRNMMPGDSYVRVFEEEFIQYGQREKPLNIHLWRRETTLKALTVASKRSRPRDGRIYTGCDENDGVNEKSSKRGGVVSSREHCHTRENEAHPLYATIARLIRNESVIAIIDI